MSESSQNPPEEFVPFLSFASLRDTHRELLKERRGLPKDNEELHEQFWTAVNEFLERGSAAGAYLDDDSDREQAQNLLDFWNNQLFHAGHETPEAILIDFDLNSQEPIPDHLCPYVGLEAFNEKNNHLFFGRSGLIKTLVEKINTNQLVAAIGPSGSGKSSAILAGLIPRLKNGAMPNSRQWHYLPTIVPGSSPLLRLAKLVTPSSSSNPLSILETSEEIKETPQRLAEMVSQLANETAVLVVDQFEETFTLCQDELERQAFIDALLHLANSQDFRHIVIITMRTDYEAYLNKAPLFQSLVEQGEVRVAAMNASELHEAIEKPAELVGLKFEQGLVDAVVREIVGEPAALPLLQFALLQLWDNRERNRVTWDSYRRIGGVMQALATTADDIYESLLPEEQATARRILLRIVRPSTGFEFTRARVQRGTLYQMGEASDRIDRVLEKLIEARLLRVQIGTTRTDDQIEVAHEALVRNWPRLGEWLEEAAVSLRQRQRIADLAEQWDKTDRNSDALLRGVMLDQAQAYTDLNPLEQSFVRQSQALEDAEQEAREAAQKRELEQALALAEEQKRAADFQRGEAEAQRREAEALKEKNEALSMAERRTRYLSAAVLVIFLGTTIFLVALLIGANDRANQISARATSESGQATSEAVATEAIVENTRVVATAEAETTRVNSTAEANVNEVSSGAATTEAVATNDVATQIALQRAEGTAEAVAQQTQQAVAVTQTAVVFQTSEARQTAIAASTSTPSSSTTGENGNDENGSETVGAPDSLTNEEIAATRLAEINAAAIRLAQLREQDGMSMVYVSGGEFVMGNTTPDDDAAPDALPTRIIEMPPFFIDQYEVSVFQYATFLNQTGTNNRDCDGNFCALSLVETIYSYLRQDRDGTYRASSGYTNAPINQVSWFGAQAYCDWVGARLPTEAEWEYAARGFNGRTYPWGDGDPDSTLAVYNIRAFFPDNIFTPLLAVDALPGGASPFNVFGMAGGVQEWVADWYQEDYYSFAGSTFDPNDNAESGEKVLRGGGWNSNTAEITSFNRGHIKPAIDPNAFIAEADDYWGIGFRCAADVP